MRYIKFLATVVMLIATIVVPLAQAHAGEWQDRRRDNNEAAAMMFGMIAGAIIGGAIANNNGGYRQRPRYYNDGFYQPRPRYYGNGYYQPRRYYPQRQFQVRPCPNLGHYQGRIIYRNGCYYPG